MYVEIHNGNVPSKSKGCFLVGEQFDKRDPEFITHSVKTLEKLISQIKNIQGREGPI